LHLREGAAVTNFDQRLAPPHAGLATQILKDPSTRPLPDCCSVVHRTDWSPSTRSRASTSLSASPSINLCERYRNRSMPVSPAPSIAEIEAELSRDLELKRTKAGLRAGLLELRALHANAR
jgi:hypothetical protein